MKDDKRDQGYKTKGMKGYGLDWKKRETGRGKCEEKK